MHTEYIPPIKHALNSLDESTDVQGLYTINLLIGMLKPDIPSQTFLTACQQLEKTNHETIPISLVYKLIS